MFEQFCAGSLQPIIFNNKLDEYVELLNYRRIWEHLRTLSKIIAEPSCVTDRQTESLMVLKN